MLDVDEEYSGVLFLSTLNANLLQFTTSTLQQIYAWNIPDWSKILGNPEQGVQSNLPYKVTHRFYPNFTWLPGGYAGSPATTTAACASNIGFASYPLVNAIQVSTNLLFPNISSSTKTGTFNGNVTRACNYISKEIAKIIVGGTTCYFGLKDITPDASFICTDPRTINQVIITTSPMNSGMGITAASNAINTTGDFYTSGVHVFYFKKLRPKIMILKTIRPQITGTLSLATTNSTTQNFTASSGEQVYSWANINWTQVLGQFTGRKWRVTHEFIPNTLPNAVTPNADPIYGSGLNAASPGTPAFLFSSNLATNSLATNWGRLPINAMSFYYIFSLTSGGATYWDLLVATQRKLSSFITSAPENLAQLTVSSIPTQNFTYTGPPSTPVVISYPNDQYTNGIHRFTFELLE